jgi:hypothetical protein
MPDQLGYITEETDPTLWESLKKSWESDRKPGTVMRGGLHYVVVVTNDIPKFRNVSNESLYNSVSMER